MVGVRSVVEVAVMGAVALGLTVAMVWFGVRVIGQAESAGRADRRSLWRVAAIRVLVGVLAVCGGVVIAEGSFLVLSTLLGSTTLAFLSGPQARWLMAASLVPMIGFAAASAALYRIVEPAEVAGAARSFPVLRRLRTRGRIAWMTARRRCSRKRVVVRVGS